MGGIYTNITALLRRAGNRWRELQNFDNDVKLTWGQKDDTNTPWIKGDDTNTETLGHLEIHGGKRLTFTTILGGYMNYTSFRGLDIGSPASATGRTNGSLNCEELFVDGVDFRDIIYPVGSLYFNYVDDTNPASLIGVGTWEAVAVGKTLIGDDGATNDYEAQDVGGSDTQTLSSANLASHKHAFRQLSVGGVAADGVYSTSGGTSGSFDNTASGSVQNTGSNQPFSIVQSYEVVYIWKRTA